MILPREWWSEEDGGRIESRQAPTTPPTFTLTQAPSKSGEVPLWAFIVMTVFALVLMIFVGVLLWKPLTFHPAKRLAGLHDKQRDAQKPLKSSSPPSRSPSSPEPALQPLVVQPPADDGSGRPPWFRGGSLRRDIDKWRRNIGPLSTNGGDDGRPPSYINYAPPATRGPASRLQRISEFEFYCDIKTSPSPSIAAAKPTTQSAAMATVTPMEAAAVMAMETAAEHESAYWARSAHSSTLLPPSPLSVSPPFNRFGGRR